MIKTTRRALRATTSSASACSAMAIVMVLPPAVAALYLAKSALGINLLPGPSPLHDLLYHLVR